MAMFTTSRYFSALFLLIFYLRTDSNADTEPSTSFYFKNFGKESNFESEIALFGDARVVNGSGLCIQLSGSVVNTTGGVLFKEPFNLVEAKPRRVASFSMYVVFSMSNEDGDGLVFMMAPDSERKDRFVGVEFDTSKNENYGDMNDNHVGIDVGSFISVKSANASLANLVLKSGEKLQSWVDYQASSRRIEVRVCKMGEPKPADPLLSCPIDLLQMWKDSKVVVGLTASSGNTRQKCNVYSWSFRLWSPPQWMHSEPMDPKAYADKTQEEIINNLDKKSDCALRVVAALIFGTGCGALGALVVLFVWTILGNGRPVVPVDYAVPAKDAAAAAGADDELKMEKIVGEKTIQDGKK